MLVFDSNGIFCPQAGAYIDPWKPVDKAIITHAHSDHARWGMKAYLAHKDAIPVMRYRLGNDADFQSLEFHEPVFMNGVKITLHPAGHIWGSAQVRLEYKGEIWVVSGDYKMQPDGISPPFEPVRCHHFITESTFGLPVYKFPDPATVHADINSWWKQNRDEGKNTVLMGYPLGKAQRIIKHLDPSIGEIWTHGAIDNVNRIYLGQGGTLPECKRILPETDRKMLRGAMIIAPPSAVASPWLRKLDPYRWALCSGWMQLRGTRRRRGADRGFVLSDHADWNELNTAIRETGAENIYVTHGYKTIYANWLKSLGYNATEVETLYTGETLEGESESGLTEIVEGEAAPAENTAQTNNEPTDDAGLQ
jgi:putative mRNA 3-end processing factor